MRNPLNLGGLERRMQHLFSQPVRIARFTINLAKDEVLFRALALDSFYGNQYYCLSNEPFYLEGNPSQFLDLAFRDNEC